MEAHVYVGFLRRDLRVAWKFPGSLYCGVCGGCVQHSTRDRSPRTGPEVETKSQRLPVCDPFSTSASDDTKIDRNRRKK